MEWTQAMLTVMMAALAILFGVLIARRRLEGNARILGIVVIVFATVSVAFSVATAALRFYGR
jgi:hypothetical protein